MSYEKKVSKDHYGWSAETYVPMDNGMTLILRTAKRGSGVMSTNAKAATISHSDGFTSETHVYFQDFNKTAMSFPQVSRATEKSISEAHDQALQIVPAILAEANAFYQNQPKEYAE